MSEISQIKDGCVSATHVLTEYFVIEHTESGLFRSYEMVLQDCGVWADFLKFFLDSGSSYPQIFSGSAADLSWTYTKFMNSNKHRYQFEIMVGDEKMVISLHPHTNFNVSGSPYVDYRFSISASKEEIIMTALLFKEFILGENTWDG